MSGLWSVCWTRQVIWRYYLGCWELCLSFCEALMTKQLITYSNKWPFMCDIPEVNLTQVYLHENKSQFINFSNGTTNWVMTALLTTLKVQHHLKIWFVSKKSLSNPPDCPAEDTELTQSTAFPTQTQLNWQQTTIRLFQVSSILHHHNQHSTPRLKKKKKNTLLNKLPLHRNTYTSVLLHLLGVDLNHLLALWIEDCSPPSLLFICSLP